MPRQLGVDQRTQLGVDGGQHLGQLLHLHDRQPPGGQGVGHLQADVAPADDHRGGRGALLEGAHDREGVAHRVEQVHAVARPERTGPGQAGDRGTDRYRAGADDQLVVGEQFLAAAGGCHQELAGGDVDPAGGGVQPQAHPGGFQISDAAVSEVAPVGDLTGEVIGNAADREVRVSISEHNGDVRAGVELADPQRGADPGVATADHDQVHGRLPSGWVVSGAGPDRKAGPRKAMRRHAPRGRPVRLGSCGGGRRCRRPARG